jgi:hypothetical protein
LKLGVLYELPQDAASEQFQESGRAVGDDIQSEFHSIQHDRPIAMAIAEESASLQLAG